MNDEAREVKSMLAKGSLGRDDIMRLLSADEGCIAPLFDKADAVRRQNLRDDVFIRAIIEFSNHCRNDCFYCGIRAGNRDVARYRMDTAEIVETARHAVEELGIRTVLLQSGEDAYYTRERIVEIIRAIKDTCDCVVALSIGEYSLDDYRAFYETGARRTLVKFETASSELYRRYHPESSAAKKSHAERIALLRGLRDMGFSLASGIMVGLPGQTAEDYAESLLLLGELGIGMGSIGPFVACPGTPLADAPNGSVEMTLRLIAIARIMYPKMFIPATTATQSLDPRGWEKALRSGANVLMTNVTPPKYKEKYVLYPGKVGAGAEAVDSYKRVAETIREAGRTIGQGYGNPEDYR